MKSLKARDGRFPVRLNSDVDVDAVLAKLGCTDKEMQAVQANEIFSYSRRGILKKKKN